MSEIINNSENKNKNESENKNENENEKKKSDKRSRKKSAKPLPIGITQDMLQKYVVYYHEWLNIEQTKSREFFKVEKHPKLKKIWIGCKSNKVSIQDKLKQANQKVVDLNLPTDVTHVS
jgi:hypothetical protein